MFDLFGNESKSKRRKNGEADSVNKWKENESEGAVKKQELQRTGQRAQKNKERSTKFGNKVIRRNRREKDA